MQGDKQKLRTAWNEYMIFKDDEKETVKVPHRYSFSVDLDQEADQYDKGKAVAYKRAVAMWNAVDTSKRIRIGVTLAQE